ncbi:HAD family hydrolase [Nonlabens agnitus]|uniref:HAD family hydrolase n=1 Tax=Nonlabens agnitus TaxID=870484 RepID=A0A2S9WX72_9FLAO|nr:HAD family hydrolase [Nonlabens agnitus]PRP68069.1 HAD family hydrolase [Nonlabens agnitus]
MIQLIATDIDGTLLDGNRFISAKTAEIFNQLELPKILISARMPQAMYYLQEALNIQGLPIVCYNGALVLHQEEVLHSDSISFDIIKDLAAIGVDHDIHVSLYRGKEWFVTQRDQWTLREINNTRVEPTVQDLEDTMAYFKKTQDAGGAHKIMFMGNADRMELAFAKAEKHHSSMVHLYRSKDTYTEISPKNISKKSALELLIQRNYPSIAMSGVAAFGDNYNDTEMLAGAGYGIAVANGRDEVKQAANHVTAHHKEDGVALWLEEFILNKKATL